MSNYKELIEQRTALDLKIKQAREQELGEAIAKVKELVASFDLTPKDIFARNINKRSGETMRVPPKYRNPTTGDTWTGRGKAPKWIQNVPSKEQFLIEK